MWYRDHQSQCSITDGSPLRDSSGVDSRTIIDGNGAEKLLGRGDMLYLPMGENKPIRVQGDLYLRPEVERVVEFVTDQRSQL